MLKQSPLIDELALVDTSGTCGFGIELGHIDTKCKVSAYSSLDSLPESLEVKYADIFFMKIPLKIHTCRALK